MRNGDNGPSRLLGRLAAEKKKTVIALCLIGVMVLMWARMLTRNTPESAGAALMTQEAIEGRSNSEIKVCFRELPKVKGRNDVLSRDFFASDDWQSFVRDGEGRNSSGTEEVSVVSGDGSEEVVMRVAAKLRLQLIWLDKNPQVFINDKLLSVGDKLAITEGADTYECEVAGIEENKVFIRFGEAEITLKFVQTEVTD